MTPVSVCGVLPSRHLGVLFVVKPLVAEPKREFLGELYVDPCWADPFTRLG